MIPVPDSLGIYHLNLLTTTTLERMDILAILLTDRFSLNVKALLLFLAFAVFLGLALRALLFPSPLNSLPTAGSSLPIVSLFHTILRTQGCLHEGYERTKDNGGLFKLASPTRWIVVATSPDTIQDVYRAPDHELSAFSAIEETLQFTHTLSQDVLSDPYHFPLFTSLLSKRLDELTPMVFDELSYVFANHFAEVPHLAAGPSQAIIRGAGFIEDLIARASNRVFVGKPLCRDDLYIKLVLDYILQMTFVGFIISATPRFLRGFLARFISPRGSRKTVERLLAPVIQERENREKGEKNLYPSDFLSDMIEADGGRKKSLEDLTLRILHVNFAGISSTAMIATLLIQHIASRPDWQAQIYEEIKEVIDQEGWKYAALPRMAKLDSMIKEVMRYHHFSSITLGRLVTDKPFTFSNGVEVPPGTLLGAASREVCLEHFGSEIRPFRFAVSGDDDVRQATAGCTSTSSKFMAWGHGRHTCPGRYFAVCLIKSLVSYTIYNYELSIAGDRVCTPKWSFVMSAPDKRIQVIYRQRDPL